jgi:glucokinase
VGKLIDYDTLGTGVGSGVIYHGKLTGTGGELGHLVLKAGGRRCTCGRIGCVEAYASATALIRDAKEVALAHPESLLNSLCHGELDNMNGEIPFVAADEGDEAAIQVVEDYIDALAELAADIGNFYHPEKIVIGGGVSAQGKRLTMPVEQKANAKIFGGKYLPEVQIIAADLGNEAGIIGAAGLLLQ